MHGVSDRGGRLCFGGRASSRVREVRLRPTLAKSGSAWQDGPKYQLCLKNSHDDATYTTGILGMCRQTYNQRILKTKVTIVRYGPAKFVTWQAWEALGASLIMVV